MHSRSSSVIRIAIRALPVVLVACGTSPLRPPFDANATGGFGGAGVGAGGTVPVGASASGGTGGGEGPATAGTVGTGGAPGTGGQQGSGTGHGGDSTVGGTLSTGGADVASGGATGLAGSLVPSGGRPGSGGNIGTGGAPATGGQPGTGTPVTSGGQPGTGGISAIAGSKGTGGTLATGGSSGTITLPARFVGNIDTRGALRSDFATYWDQFTPENAGKWASVQGSSSTSYNWSALDAMVKYCEENHIIFKQHNFVWGGALPSWMSGLTTTTGPAAVQDWMKAFCTRYPKTQLIDVVNEPPPHTTPSFAKVIGGGTNTTWDWIANAFKWAREACPNAVLILNDYDNAEYASAAQHTIDIVTAIQKLGAPIDAVGCETHGAAALPASTLKANIDAIASATGLPVYITEYDIGLADDNKQQQQYQDHFTMFMSNPNIAGITVWGYIVGATWISNSGLMTSDGTMRPAMSWLMNFLGR